MGKHAQTLAAGLIALAAVSFVIWRILLIAEVPSPANSAATGFPVTHGPTSSHPASRPAPWTQQVSVAGRPPPKPRISPDDTTPRNIDPTQIIAGPESNVADLAFSSDGTMLASAHENGSICLWNPQSGAMIREIKTGVRPGAHLVFARTSHRLALTGKDGKWSVWNADDGVMAVHADDGVASGAVVFFPDDDHVLLTEADALALCDSQDARLLQEVPIGGHPLCLDVSPDGAQVAVGTDGPAVLILDKSLATVSSRTQALTALGEEAHKHWPAGIDGVRAVHFAPQPEGFAPQPHSLYFTDHFGLWDWKLDDNVVVARLAGFYEPFAATTDFLATGSGSMMHAAPLSENEPGGSPYAHNFTCIAACPAKRLLALAGAAAKSTRATTGHAGDIYLFGPEILPELERHIRFERSIRKGAPPPGDPSLMASW